MALAGDLEKNGTPPTSVETEAACTVSPDPAGGFSVKSIALDVTAVVPGIDDAKFQEIASGTLRNCPVSKAFRGNLELTVNARLQS